MKVNLPSCPTHPLVRVTVKSPKGESTTMLDDSHSTLEIEVPRGVSEDRIEVTAQLCDTQGEADRRMEPIVLKAKSEATAKKDPPKSKPADKPVDKQADKPTVNKTDASKPQVPQQ